MLGFSAMAALLAAITSFIILGSKLLLLSVCWFLVKDIVETVSKWLTNIGSIAYKAISFTYKFFHSLITDARKSATPENEVKYSQVQQILESSGADSIVVAQQSDGNIIEVSGIKADNYASNVAIEENPENYFVSVTTTGNVEKIKITD